MGRNEPPASDRPPRATEDAAPPRPDGEPAAEGEGGGEVPAVENRWWVDSGSQRERRSTPARREVEGEPIVGQVFFAVGKDFDQDRARANLTDSNLNLLREGNPAEGTWAYLPMTPERTSPELLEKVRRSLRLPKWARGVLVDSGTSLRAIASGTPIGDRVVELTLGASSCLDAWANGEWVREKAFRNRDRALREGGRLLVRYLRSDPDSIT
jgi:hypothetical protein